MRSSKVGLTLDGGERSMFIKAIAAIAANDRTPDYEDDQPRPSDGRSPSPGSSWKTPREIAQELLGMLG